MRIRILMGLLGIGLLLIGVLGCSDNTDLFDLSGVTTNQATGLALSGINVSLLNSQGNQVGPTQVTNVAGEFRFLSQPEGIYSILATGTGVVPEIFGPFVLENGNINNIILPLTTQADLEVIAPTATVPTNGTATVVAFGADALGDPVDVTVEVGLFGPSVGDNPAVLTDIDPDTYIITVREDLMGGGVQEFRNVKLTANTVTIVRAGFIGVAFSK